MEEKSLNIISNRLIEVLIHNIVFYIPSKIIRSDVLEKLQDPIHKNFLDEISILDVYQGIGIYEIEEFDERLLNKHTRLENNIFEILKLKDNVEVYKFDFILEKYFRQVEFYYFVMDWLNINLSKYNGDDIDIITIGFFRIQNTYYKKHFEQLINLFYDPEKIMLKESFNSLELAETYFPDLIARFRAAGIKHNTKENNVESIEQLDENLKLIETKENKNKKIKRLKKTIKKSLISEEEAEYFLLENVFNLKFI